MHVSEAISRAHTSRYLQRQKHSEVRNEPIFCTPKFPIRDNNQYRVCRQGSNMSSLPLTSVSALVDFYSSKDNLENSLWPRHVLLAPGILDDVNTFKIFRQAF